MTSKKYLITHADIMRRIRESGLDISHENVRYYRVNRDVPKKRKKGSKYAAAIEAAEQKLINELISKLKCSTKSGKTTKGATTRKPQGISADDSASNTPELSADPIGLAL